MRCLVKICGVTSVVDALAAVDAGADVIGLNFYEQSPRCIHESTAREILEALPGSVKVWMLAVKESWEQTLARRSRLPRVDLVQVHHPELTPCPAASVPWIPAFSVKDISSLQAITEFLDGCSTAGVLVDAHVPGSLGGTGRVLPWQLLTGFDPGVPLILAGGLTPDNVGDAVRMVRPFMVDVASGVESAPGRKDRDKMKAFVKAVREASL